MVSLILKCKAQGEPVLLIGETGCGKTTASQLIAFLDKQQLFYLNCHQYTESSDFLGSLRPIRKQETLGQEIEALCESLRLWNPELVHEIKGGLLPIKHKLAKLDAVQELVETTSECLGRRDEISSLLCELRSKLVKSEAFFEWQDGCLVQAMQQGGVFLIDEISLAEDSVLERLNSVLEFERTLLLPEKGSLSVDEIKPKAGFFVIATMNPGGDYGKKELSPALRNRFTEIWVEPITSKSYL